jgi:phosphate transport system protein
LRLLALQQPVMAYDLRFVGSAMKVVTDFERIGDHAVNIAKVAHRIRYAGIAYEPIVDFPRFQDIVCRMLADVTVAFANRDTMAAEAVIALDDEADVFYKETVRELRLAMTDGRVSSGRVLLCSHLLFVAHYLERIGDHSCNIAERILFMEKGKRPARPGERARTMTRPA